MTDSILAGSKYDGIEETVLLATASVILVLALITAAILCLRAYRPTPVPVVEQARVLQDVRAKVNTDARMRLRLHQQRRAGRSHLPMTTLDVAPDVAQVSAPDVAQVSAPDVAQVSAPVSAQVSRATTGPALPLAPGIQPGILVQAALVHHRDGAPRPGSYFRIVESPSQETIISAVRGPWASEIVTGDGRITLPDSDADVALAWSGSE